MTKPNPALKRHVASLADIKRMNGRAELRAKTCPACDTTYKTAWAANDCRDWHRSSR